MKTTVIHIGSTGKEWEGPLENWEAHSDKIKHWCDGGDVEQVFETSERPSLLISNPEFRSHFAYRIKQREPKHGEVWTNRDDRPSVWNAAVGKFVNLWSNDNLGIWTDGVIKYSAPSVEAYYARGFLKRRNDGPLTCTVLQDAAQLDH